VIVPRPRTPQAQRQAHVIAAWAWFAFGVYGLIEYLVEAVTDVELFAVANSIPVLFAISVYANFVGHLSSAQAAQAEVKVEQAVDLDAEHVNVDRADEVHVDAGQEGDSESGT
jgi:hypothetical protein